jgi:hypothetical protein
VRSILDFMIWIAGGAIAGALVASVCSLDGNEPGRNRSRAIQIMVFAGTGTLVGSAVYVTLAYTLYDYLPFSF